jgi:hypothetical protein
MTGGGDTGEFEDVPADDPIDAMDDDTVEGDDVAPPVDEPILGLDLNDRIPSAGIADIGGRAGSAADDGTEA